MTCRHYRFQVPRMDADELREADATPCPLCDHQQRANFQMIDWSPKPVRTASRNSLANLRKRIGSWFKPEPHDVPAPVSRPC